MWYIFIPDPYFSLVFLFFVSFYSNIHAKRFQHAHCLRARQFIPDSAESWFFDLYGKPCKRDWVAKVVLLIQMFLTFGGRYNRYFWDTRLKILRLLNFNMLFQLVLTKFFKSELFACLPKVDHVIKSCKDPITRTHLRCNSLKLVSDSG